MHSTVTMLDSAFEITATRDDALHYTTEFLRAYGRPIKTESSQASERIAIGYTASSAVAGGAAIPIHRSKHPHWSFDGVAQADGAVAWPTREIVVGSNGPNDWRIDITREAEQPIIGEAVFHALRSIALYRRSGELGPMLHASGVVHNGAATLFTGPVSAGKTTLLTESVVAHGATPLTNDRTRLRFGDKSAIAPPSPLMKEMIRVGGLLELLLATSSAQKREI